MNIETALLILNISSDNPSITKIKNAYRVLAKKYHPDSSGRKEHIRFVLVQEAYELLKDVYKHNTFIEPDEEEIEDEPPQPIQSKNSDEIFISNKLSKIECLLKENTDYTLFAKELGELNYFLKVSGYETNTKKLIIPLFDKFLLICQKALDQFDEINITLSFIITLKKLFPDNIYTQRLDKFDNIISYKEKVNDLIKSIENEGITDVEKMKTCHQIAQVYIKNNDIKNAVRFTRLGQQFQKKIYQS